MSLADHIFINMCKDILENGTSTEGEKVRPHWEDGTPAYTIKKFGVVNRYDLRKEFPAAILYVSAMRDIWNVFVTVITVFPTRMKRQKNNFLQHLYHKALFVWNLLFFTMGTATLHLVNGQLPYHALCQEKGLM